MNQLLEIKNTKDQSTKIVWTNQWAEKTPLALLGKANLFLAVRPGKPWFIAGLLLLTQSAEKMILFDQLYVEPRFSPFQFFWKNHKGSTLQSRSMVKERLQELGFDPNMVDYVYPEDYLSSSESSQ